MTSEVQIRNPDVEPEAQITVTGSARLHTYLRRESYYLAMYLLKQETTAQRAQFIGMSERGIAKALEGNPISGEFVANLLTRLQPHSKKLARVGHEVTFETYFEVREEQS
jgi:hypothetical protein